MSRSTVSPVTVTSAYCVMLPSASRTTASVASAMARILPRKRPRASGEVEHEGDPHAQALRAHGRRERHAADLPDGGEGRVVEDLMAR